MKLASIEIVREIKPHTNADKLELATVQGWQTVVKKGEFKAGDHCVFVPPDTILPEAPWSAFLKDKNRPDKPIRLKTAKIRGEYSQGLVLPLSVLPLGSKEWHESADVGGELGIKKYEKEVSLAISGEQRGNFPTWVAPKTDEDNGLSNLSLVERVLREPVIVTLKLDGSSCTIVAEDGKIENACSRNVDLVDDGKNAFWFAAKKLKLNGFSGVIQGELMGPGIQGNQLGLNEPTLYVFQVKQNDLWQDYPAIKKLSEQFGCPCVPTVWACNTTTLADLQNLADNLTIREGVLAEGIVVRPQSAKANGNGRPLGFKLINRNYGE